MPVAVPVFGAYHHAFESLVSLVFGVCTVWGAEAVRIQAQWPCHAARASGSSDQDTLCVDLQKKPDIVKDTIA